MAAIERPESVTTEPIREFRRAVNERIRALGSAQSSEDELVCECDDAGCFRVLRMGAEEYQALRSYALLFAVAPGHERDGSDELLVRTAGFVIVRTR